VNDTGNILLKARPEMKTVKLLMVLISITILFFVSLYAFSTWSLKDSLLSLFVLVLLAVTTWLIEGAATNDPNDELNKIKYQGYSDWQKCRKCGTSYSLWLYHDCPECKKKESEVDNG
jgi:multisubunit Na+/H+ antiporter MnhG subunit